MSDGGFVARKGPLCYNNAYLNTDKRLRRERRGFYMQREERRIAEILLRRPLTPQQRRKMLRENPVYHDCYGRRVAAEQAKKKP